MAEAKVKTTAKPASGSVSTFEAKMDTPSFGMPKFEIPRFDMPRFDMPKMEVPAAFRELAERSVAQAREGYERMKAAAEDTTDAWENTYASASKGATELTLKSLEIARANTNAAFDFASELVGVKSLSEAVELTSTYTRKQLDSMLEQSKQLSALAQKIATETTEPMKSGVTKAFKVAA